MTALLSCVLIIPVAQQAEANALAEAMGWGPGSYSVPLSPTGTDPATHYGLHSWVDDSFVSMLQGAARGQAPQALLDAGYPAQDLSDVMSNLISDVTASMDGHFDAVCVAHGLQRIVPAGGPGGSA